MKYNIFKMMHIVIFRWYDLNKTKIMGNNLVLDCCCLNLPLIKSLTVGPYLVFKSAHIIFF